MVEIADLNKILDMNIAKDILAEIEKNPELFCEITRHDGNIKRPKRTAIQREIRDYSTFEYEKRHKHLWSLWGKVKNNKWVCVEVGSSNDIKSEISEIISLMVSVPYEVGKTGLFHEDVNIYSFYTYSDKNSCKYRRCNELFKEFIWIEINVEKYTEALDIGEYNCVDYAEVKYAFDNKALLWNPAPAMNKNKEKEILRNFVD
jgi:hypothetical protein